MKTKNALKLIAPTALFGIVLSVPAFAQETAGQDMRQAGHEMKQAGADTAMAAKDVAHGTARATKDTAITAAVKSKLATDNEVKASAIHVRTRGGIVTLAGKVPSPEIAQHVQQLAEQTDGVKSVNNQLMVISSSRTD
jgi:osmotically-inducible protein OsmY